MPLKESGPWIPVPGASGSVPAGGQTFVEGGEIVSLTPETKYYDRAQIENGTEPSIEPIYKYGTFETKRIRPEASTCEIYAVAGASANAKCNLDADGSETNWRVEYATSKKALEEGAGTVAVKGTITAAEAEEELQEEEDKTGSLGRPVFDVELTGLAPETTYYVNVVAENKYGVAEGEAQVVPNGLIEREDSTFETGGLPRATTSSVHSVHGDVLRALGTVEPHGFDTHYYVEYVTQEQFAESGWVGAEMATAIDLGDGVYARSSSMWATEVVAEDLPGLQAGKIYHYRFVATSTYTGNPVVDGNEQTFTVPVPGPAGAASCPNEQLRTGFSAALPDCRAYELLTPPDKEGAMDIGTYGNVSEAAYVGEDGNHLMYTAPGTAWAKVPIRRRARTTLRVLPEGGR